MTTYFDIEALQNGKKWAFEEIYNDFFDTLFYLALGYIGQREPALELVQDSFVKLWENRSHLRKNTNIKNYLYTLIKNSSLNHLRHEEIINRGHKEYLIPELQHQQELITDFPDTFESLEDLIKKVDAAIDNLSPEISEAFRLNRFEGFTYQEISVKQGVSPKTVEARISKALKILRKELKDYLPVIELLLIFKC